MSKDSTEVLVSGPLGAFSTGYANELTRQGYAPASVRLQMKMLADLSDWLLSHGIHLGDLKSSDLDGFLSNRRAAGYTRYVSVKAARPILDYLRELKVASPEVEVVDGPVEVMLNRYRRFLTVERSLAHVTARCYRPTASSSISDT